MSSAARLPPAVLELPSELVSGAQVLASRIEILPLLPKGRVFAEIGVGLGHFTRQVLNLCQPSTFIAIDAFRLHEIPNAFGQTTQSLFGELSHRAYYSRQFQGALLSGQMHLMEGDSAAMLSQLDDQSIDIAYVDGDHSYDGVTKDLKAVLPKIKRDGYIIVNDYILVDQLNTSDVYGVIYATNEFMVREGWRLEYFALQTNMYCDVVLRKVGQEAQRPIQSTGSALLLQDEKTAQKKLAESTIATVKRILRLSP